ncbi:hypothetical protein ABGB07_02300 [Micromonosporaceae bacterium B7E4]
MADQLCTPEDLAALLQQDLDLSTATVAIEAATAVVQEAAGGQRILEVEDDEITLLGTTESWLDLPQRPVTAVTAVELDGEALTEGTGTGQYRRFGARLWRGCGWAACAYAPSTVAVTNTHGWPAGSQQLQLARSAVLGLARAAYVNPAAVTREAIDDYSVAYEAAAAEMEASQYLKAALRRQYGRRAGLVRIG